MAYKMGPPHGYTEISTIWNLQSCPVYTGIKPGRRQSSMAARLSPMMRHKWTRAEAVREIAQNMCDACVMSVSPKFVENLASSSFSGIQWKTVPLEVPGDSDVRGWKLYMNDIYAAEVCGLIEQQKDGQFITKVMFYNRGRAIPANFFLSNTTDKDSSKSISEFIVGGFGQGLKDAIATLMDESAMSFHPIQAISFFGYSPRSPDQPSNDGTYKSTARKRFILKKVVKPHHVIACDMGLDEKDATLQVCYSNSHDKLPKSAKCMLEGDVPGTVVSFQFEAMAFSGAKKQLDLIMHAFEAHILFDPTAKGVWLRLEAKHPQPSKVFTSCKSWEGSHSKVFIYPGLLLSCADTPDTQGFSVMLSKKDLGSSFVQGRERVVCWGQVQKKFVRAISTAAVQEVQTHAQTPDVFNRLQTIFHSILGKNEKEIQRTSAFFHYFCETQTMEKASMEHQLFSHLLGQNTYHVHKDDTAYAQEVLGLSRQVVGVACKKLLQIIHFPETSPSREAMVANAIKTSCVESSIWKRPLDGDGWNAIHTAFADKVPRTYMVSVPSKFIGTPNRWIEIDNEKCLVLSKDTEPQLTARAFYFMIMDHDAIRPLVSERFWTLLSQSPASFDVGRDDDSDGANDDIPLQVLFMLQSEARNNGDRSPACNQDSKPLVPAATVTASTPITAPRRPQQHEHQVTPANTAHKRPLHEREAGDCRDVTSASDRQLKVCVRKADFDEVCVTVEAGVRFEACVASE